MKLSILSGLCLLLISGFPQAGEVELKPGHPEHYTVDRGDTLWDIAGKFLTRPWQWPEIWRENPQIVNPQLIYPGDELVLDVVNGKPRLQVASRLQYAPRDSQSRPDEEKLVPVIRVEPLGKAIPMIPLNAIQPFLMQTKVVDAGVMEQAPYIVDFADEHVAGGAGNQIYVRGLADSRLSGYMVFRAGNPYQDAETGDILGYEALYVADAEFQRAGDPSIMLITKSNRDVRIGDRILPVAREQLQMGYQPHPPAIPIKGHIIAVVDGVSQIGQYSVVTIDRGTVDGIETGHVLEIRKSGMESVYRAGAMETINIPSEKEGFLMVFRPYDRVSFALVMNAARAIQLKDAVLSPSTLTPPSDIIAELRFLLALLRTPRVGPRTFGTLLERFGSAGQVFGAPYATLASLGLTTETLEWLKKPDWKKVDNDLRWLEFEGHHCLTLQAQAYPQILGEIADPPPLLFVRGDVDALACRQIALVGSRNPSPGGEKLARDFSHALVETGFAVTSGLALGIDAAAHLGALDGNGLTVAVAGTGLDQVYPRRHQDLAEAIVGRGGFGLRVPNPHPAPSR